MITRARTILMFAVLVISLTSSSAFASYSSDRVVTALSWNLQVDGAPFVVQANSARADFAGPLTYPAEGFSLPLSQPLIYSTSCDCFSLTVERRSNELEL